MRTLCSQVWAMDNLRDLRFFCQKAMTRDFIYRKQTYSSMLTHENSGNHWLHKCLKIRTLWYWEQKNKSHSNKILKWHKHSVSILRNRKFRLLSTVTWNIQKTGTKIAYSMQQVSGNHTPMCVRQTTDITNVVVSLAAFCIMKCKAHITCKLYWRKDNSCLARFKM